MLKDQFDYIAHGPKQGPARKLVVLLHGYGVNASFMEKMADELLKKIPDVLVLCPHAPRQMDLPETGHEDLAVPPPEEAKMPPQGLAPEGQLEWFEITRSPVEMNDALLAVAAKMNIFIDGYRDALEIEDRDIAIMGFSQGGAVALYTACTRKGGIGCAVGHSTIIVDTGDFISKPPVLLVHGTDDRNFTLDEFKRHSVIPLKAYLSNLKITEINGLGHTTSSVSRKAVSDYIASHLNGPR